jgi:two-component system alkaline phosphatase synthesis response regulator PhoP
MADILIIEPDKQLAFSYQRALESKNFSVAVAKDGQAAIVAVDQAVPRLICLEIHLPNNNGIEFLYELRSYPDWEGIPVALMTFIPEQDMQLSDQQKNELGIDHYFYKPRMELKNLVSYAEALLK